MKVLVTLALVIAASQLIAAPGDLVVVAKAGIRSADLTRSFGGAVRSNSKPNLFVIKAGSGVSLEALRRDSRFAAVTVDRFLEPCALPDDPFVPQQWHLTQISAPRAWDYATGGTGPVVAVVDAGCETTHPDLAANMVPGYNTISGLPESAGGAVNDIGTTGHGTRCMSIAVARGNNGIGISGVGWNLRGMPIRATNNANGTALISELLEGVTWAVDNGARVVSVSYSGVADPTIEAVGAWARTQGALLVWAAGNDNLDLSGFDHKNVTIVGGTDHQDAKISLSNFGRAVDCYAPATQVYTARKGGLYGNMPAGTSAAVPQVAAALALMMEREPGMSPDQIEQRLFRRCRDLGALGNDPIWGWGRINAGTSVGWPQRTYDLSFLPVPAGLNWTSGIAINNSGRIIGNGGLTNADGSNTLISWLDGDVEASRNAVFQYSPANRFVGVGDLTESGLAIFSLILDPLNHDIDWSVLSAENLYGGGSRNFLWNIQADTLTNQPLGVFPSISELGVMAGTAWGTPHPNLLQLGTSLQNVPGPAGSTFSAFFGISDQGIAAGGTRSTPFTDWWTELRAMVYYPGIQSFQILGDGLGTVSRARNVTASGVAYGEAGNSRDPSALQPVKWDLATPSVVEEIKGPDGIPIGPGFVVLDINENGEVLAQKMDVQPTVPFIFDTISSGPIQTLLSEPLSPLYGNLRVGRGVNEHGELAGSVTNTATGFPRAIKLTPNDGRFLSIGFGSDGANPVYIGSIPPALSVTFTDASGAPVSGTSMNLSYNSATGQMPLNVPPQVGSSFRMYVRANRDVIPGYEGTRFLSRLIPPMDQPPAPRDIAYLPMSGTPGPTGQPSIQLFAGDVDGSNEIDAADIDLVIAAFGSVNGDPGWNPDPDCDGSGEVDAADIDRVIENFGLVGDPEP